MDKENKNKDISEKKRVKEKAPWTLKRIAALTGVVLLFAMYAAGLVSVLFRFPGSDTLLRLCFALTIALPIFLWVLVWAVGVLTHKKNFASMNFLNSNPEERKKMEEALQKAASAGKEEESGEQSGS